MIDSINSSYGNMTDYQPIKRPSKEEFFSKLDTNQDGSLDQTELQSINKNRPKVGKGGPDPEKMFNDMDSDGDGLISETEFVNFEPPKPPVPPMEEAQFSGSSALQDFLSALNETASNDDSLDTNGDGTVDAEEAKAGVLSYLYDQVDKYYSQSGSTQTAFDLSS